MRSSKQCISSGVLAALAGLGFFACAAQDATLPPDAVRLESQILVQQRDAYSSYDEPARLVIRDAGEWTQLWAEVAGQGSAPPSVDFTRDMVLVAAMGQRNTGGYSILVEGVFEAADGIYVQVLETSPGPRCVTTQALTAPLTVVTIPRREGAVLWLERSRTDPC